MPAKPAAKKETPKRAPRSTQKWIRNLYTLPLPIRMTDKSEIKLQARGMRGDTTPLTKEQLADPKMQSNIGLSVELISDAEAKAILKSQTVNQQAGAPDYLLKHIGNPSDANRAFDQETVVVDHAQTDPGTTVAVQTPDGTLVRTQGVGPRVATNIPGSDPEFAALLAADEDAKNGESLEDILGGFQIS